PAREVGRQTIRTNDRGDRIDSVPEAPGPGPAGEVGATMRTDLSRRHFLRGVGVAVALPVLESVGPGRLLAAPEARLAATAGGAPPRTAFVYFPNGAIPAAWWPTGEGADFKFGRTLAPLEPFRKDVQVLGGLDHKTADPGPDGAGDHARGNG